MHGAPADRRRRPVSLPDMSIATGASIAAQQDAA